MPQSGKCGRRREGERLRCTGIWSRVRLGTPQHSCDRGVRLPAPELELVPSFPLYTQSPSSARPTSRGIYWSVPTRRAHPGWSPGPWLKGAFTPNFLPIRPHPFLHGCSTVLLLFHPCIPPFLCSLGLHPSVQAPSCKPPHWRHPPIDRYPLGRVLPPARACPPAAGVAHSLTQLFLKMQIQ